MALDRLASMEVFIAVMEAGSFSVAAQRLGVGQPAVSKSIAQLEESLGVSLLLRSTRGVIATEAGEHFYTHARVSIDAADEAELAARGSAASLSGRLRICAAVTFARIHIIPSLNTFLLANPELSIDIVLDDGNIDLREAGIDVALRMGALEDSGMTARAIGRSRRVVVGTPAYFSRVGEPKTPADLANHQAIVYGQRGGGSSWAFRNGTSEVSIVVKGRVQVTAAEGVRAAVFADIGVAVASEWMFSPELATGQVKAVLTDWELPAIDLWAVLPTGRMASAKARAFVAFVEDTLKIHIP
jgi:DNA-binding transcriptional LysR family regulator